MKGYKTMNNKKYEITTFTSRMQGRYICGYTCFNGYRDVNVYVKSYYNGRYTFVLDHTYAKRFTEETARRHARKILKERTM